MSNIHDDQIVKIDRLWLRVSLVAWLLAAGLLLLRVWWLGLDVLIGMAPCVICGGIAALYFVGIPFRIAVNLVLKVRRASGLGNLLIACSPSPGPIWSSGSTRPAQWVTKEKSG